MSWVSKADRPLRTEEQVAREVHEVALARGLDERASVLALMCIRQESGFWCPWNAADPSSRNYPHDSQSDDGRSVGYFQQQNGRPGDTLPEGDSDNWWGPMASRMDLKRSCDVFLSRLSDDYVTATNGQAAGQFVQRVQGSAYPDAYAKHWDYCWSLLKRALDGTPTPLPPGPAPDPVKPAPGLAPNPSWRGDPIWLADVLRAFGVDVYEAQGARERGHGDFGAIGWVLWHHTGNVNETEDGITHHPSLGLAANLLVFPDGRTCVTGTGVAWHGGAGIYPGIPEDGINQVSIGIECAYGPDFTQPWPQAQVEAMVNIGGAISWFLGMPADHQIAHKEWAGADNPLGINKQGKPDPANFDMHWFRDQIARRAAAGPTGQLEEWDVPEVKQMIQDIWDEVNRGKLGPSRAFLAPDAKPIESLLGFVYNIDGNVWDVKLTFGYLFNVRYAVEVVEHVAAHGVAPESWAGQQVDEKGKRWLAEFGQAYCQGLIVFKAKFDALFEPSDGS